MLDQWAFLAGAALQLAMLAALVIALGDLVEAVLRLKGVLAVCGTIFVLGLMGYLGFWLAYANYHIFSAVKVIILTSLMFRFALIVRQGRLGHCLSSVGEPLLYVSLFCFVVLALGFSNGGLLSPPLTAETEFGYHLPPDNIIPLLFAGALKSGHVSSPLLGDWLSSDRPPLQTGLYLTLTLSTTMLGYQIVATWLQATFLVGVWALIAAASLPTAARRTVLLACCLLPTAIINTFYTWPKLISVGYLLAIFVLAFCYRVGDESHRKIVGVLLGGLAALAMLCHGSSAFALIGIALVIVATWQWPSWRTILYAVATLVALYMPWVIYQTLVDPPGNRLVKWQLAGVVSIDKRGMIQTLRDSYGALTWHDYVVGRLANLKVMIGDWPFHLRDLAYLVLGLSPANAQDIRTSDFFGLLPSLHVFSIAVIAALFLLPFMRFECREGRSIAQWLFAAGVLTALAYAVLLFIPGSAVNHQGTYAVEVMLTIAAFIVLSLRAPVIATLLIAMQAITVTTVYGMTLPHGPEFWPIQVTGIAATLALFICSLSPVFGRAVRNEQ